MEKLEQIMSDLRTKQEAFNLKLQIALSSDEVKKLQHEILDLSQKIEWTGETISAKVKIVNLLSDIIGTLRAHYLVTPSQQSISKNPPAEEPEVQTSKQRSTMNSSNNDVPSESTYGLDEVVRADAAHYIATKIWKWMYHEDFNTAENPYALELPISQPKIEDPSANRLQLSSSRDLNKYLLRPQSSSKSEPSHRDYDRSELDTEETGGKMRILKRPSTMLTRQSKRLKEQTVRQDFRVVFSRSTGVNTEKDIVASLGGAIVESVDNATVLVAGKLLRTLKVLSALARGVPIVGHNWLEASKKADRFLDPWEYLLQDPKGEDRYAFKLKTSLLKSATRSTPLLAGCSIFVTENVTPSPKEMKAIIMSCGANFIERAPKRSWPENSFIISCEKDASNVKKMKNRPTVVSSEWILRGILK